MEININLDHLKKYGLTANHYVVLTYIYNLKDVPNMYEDYCTLLIEKGYIYQGQLVEPGKYLLLEKAYKAFFRKNYWHEFICKYPYATPQGRILHTNLREAKKIFEKVFIKSDSKFQLLMQCLTAEIEFRITKGYENYMYNVYNYLKKEHYLRFANNEERGNQYRFSDELKEYDRDVESQECFR